MQKSHCQSGESLPIIWTLCCHSSVPNAIGKAHFAQDGPLLANLEPGLHRQTHDGFCTLQTKLLYIENFPSSCLNTTKRRRHTKQPSIHGLLSQLRQDSCNLSPLLTLNQPINVPGGILVHNCGSRPMYVVPATSATNRHAVLHITTVTDS